MVCSCSNVLQTLCFVCRGVFLPIRLQHFVLFYFCCLDVFMQYIFLFALCYCFPIVNIDLLVCFLFRFVYFYISGGTALRVHPAVTRLTIYGRPYVCFWAKWLFSIRFFDFLWIQQTKCNIPPSVPSSNIKE